jgi:hypothetical protein
MPMPEIDPNALYTTEQAAKMLMQIDPGMTYEEAYREVLIAINLGKLKVAGYLQPPHGS